MNDPIITIDGPSGSGKGTIAAMLASRLGWRVLDSGALYRLVGLLVERSGADFNNDSQVSDIARQMSVDFRDGKVLLDGEDVSLAIRSETAGNNASKVAALPAVRQALLDWQRDQAGPPGLVADGRDMGTVVFPAAPVKIFLDASAEERAKRRYKQLMEKGLAANLATLTAEIRERDERDRNRAVAPLRPAEDAVVIDSTALSIEAVLDRVLQEAAKALPDLVR
jgi:cytidylate kinase